MSVPYKPLGSRVLIEKEIKAAETKTESGLIIPSVANFDMPTAKIIRTGPAVETLKEGDRVSYNTEPSRKITLNNKEYYLMYESEIEGILE